MHWRRQLTWSPHDLQWRIAVLFMVGSTLFALGSFPPYGRLVAPAVVGATFFAGSVFFTSAAYSQYFQVINGRDGGGSEERNRFWVWRPRGKLWWATAVQFLGTLFFNINTLRAWVGNVDVGDVNRLVWAPDFFGSIAFLVASHFAWLDACGRVWCVDREDRDWWVAVLNYLGSIFFMLAAIGAYTLPTTGDIVNITWVNAGTFLGAVCFFLGAYLLLDPARESVTE